MVSVSYTDLLTDLHLTITSLPQTDAEALINRAIDLLNLFGELSISNLSGSPLTVTLTSNQRGAVLLIASFLYRRNYKESKGISVGGVGLDTIADFSDPAVMAFVKGAARKLQTRYFERT